jgi:hypothetical protein
MTSNIDVSGQEIVVAETIYVKAEGRVNNLDSPNYLFDLENSVSAIAITVDYRDAGAYDKVEGNLANGALFEVKLFGLDLDSYLAHEVEVIGTL